MNPKIIALTGNIVSAWAARNHASPAQVAELTLTVGRTLTDCAEGTIAPTMAPAPELIPAVPVRKSVAPDYVVCLEDGLKFKSMKRHLRLKYGMTPDEYRAKWGLSADHPIVAPNYAKTRSELAKQIGLGRNGRGGQPVVDEAPVIEPATPEVEAAPAPQAEIAPVEAPAAEAPAKAKRGGAKEPAVAVTADELTRVVAEARSNPLATFSDKIICLVDGKMVSDLGRHISRMGIKPEAYRAQFGLPTDYPMTVTAATKWIAKNNTGVAQAA